MTIQEVETRLRTIADLHGPDRLRILPVKAHSPEAREYVIATAEHEYKITASPYAPSRTLGYLGCVARCRRARPGEDWLRGNDLPDGTMTEDTFAAILAAIVAYELVPFPAVQVQQSVEVADGTPATT